MRVASRTRRRNDLDLWLPVWRMLDGVRVDKAPTDATTQREIIEMYKHQRRS